MINIDVIYVGNTKEKYYIEIIEEYKKRLSAYCKLNLIEIKETKGNDDASDSEIEQIKISEGKRIVPYINEKTYIITLCIEGKQMSSPEFANILDKLPNNGFSKVIFIIGGPYGLSEEIKEKSNYKMSFSKMTFTHRMAKVLLLEQIYRACTIVAGGKYHK